MSLVLFHFLLQISQAGSGARASGLRFTGLPAGSWRAGSHGPHDEQSDSCEVALENLQPSRKIQHGFNRKPNLAVERTSASSSTVYSDGLRGWPKPLILER